MATGNPLHMARRGLLAASLGIAVMTSVTLASGIPSPSPPPAPTASPTASPTPAPEEILAEIEGLNAAYDALPPLEDPEQLLERNEAYESAFAQIGFERANGQPIEMGAADDVPNFPPPGIQDAPETLPGFVPVNMWVGSLDGAPIMVTSVVAADDPLVGGVIVDTIEGPHHFLPSPNAIGPLTIESADDPLLSLAVEDGSLVTFDVSQQQFV